MSLASAVAEILRCNPQIWEAPLVHGHTDFFVWWDLVMGFSKLQLLAKFKVAVCIYSGNI